MLVKNFFSHKSIEQFLIGVCGKTVRKDKRTMKYIRSLARNVEAAYKIGLTEGRSGKGLELESHAIPETLPVDSMSRLAVEYAYQAYRAGYLAGDAERGDSL